MAPRLAEVCGHILQAIEEIDAFVSDLPDHQIMHDTMRMRAIERCLQIITEAVKHLPPEARAEHPEIDWAAIVPMGNILRHEYFQLNPDVLVRVLRHDLPPLKRAVLELTPVILRGPDSSDRGYSE